METRRRILPIATGLAFACLAFESPLRAAGGDLLEPEGVWGCLMYGHPRLGDERQLLRLGADGRTDTAQARADGFRIWMPLSKWQTKRQRLSFRDPRTGREFAADLRRTTLGGTWTTATTNGGWWCAALDEEPALEQPLDSLQRSSTQDLMPPLVGQLLATPNYPRQAIRDGKEGRAVACFLVDSGGVIHDPEFVELSDEVFRATTLRALEASRYRSWTGAGPRRPGCREFSYRLDPIYN